MYRRLLKVYKNQQFLTNVLSIFINPFYFIRRGLYCGIRKHTPKLKGKLLDFGCGSKPYESLFEVQAYIGVDIENSGHPEANKKVDVFYDGKTIPFEGAHFDSLFCSEVLEHVFNIEEVLEEVHRVLKPGALALFTVPFVWDEHEVPYDFGRYSKFGIRHILEKKGFEILSLEKTTHFTEVIFQLWNLYLHNLLKTRFLSFNLVLYAIFISPFTILGIVFSFILPKQKSLYFNTVILAKKK